MEKVQPGDIVRVHYTGRLADGTVFDSSREGEPFEFKIAEGEVIPGFEQAVMKLSPGNSTETTIPADKAYGSFREDRVLVVDRSQMPADLELEVGQYLQVRREEDEQPIDVWVSEITDADVTLDGNHPLAGKDLIFEIELLEIVRPRIKF